MPQQVSAKQIWAAMKPSNRMVWGVCPYLAERNHQRCMGCPEWEEFEGTGKGKRGCRALAEEVCRIVLAPKE